jgi:catechol 2,3-dioxygenase-like lactoylglutathione lyase family enzyme
MRVKRIVANIQTSDLAAAKRFYEDALGLEVLMDLGWIVTYGSGEMALTQISVATQGGSGRRYRISPSTWTTSMKPFYA